MSRSEILNVNGVDVIVNSIKIVDNRSDDETGSEQLEYVSVDMSVTVGGTTYVLSLDNDGDGQLKLEDEEFTNDQLRDGLFVALGGDLEDEDFTEDRHPIYFFDLSNIIVLGQAKFDQEILEEAVNSDECDDDDKEKGVELNFNTGFNGIYIKCVGDGYLYLTDTNTRFGRKSATKKFIVSSEISDQISELLEIHEDGSRELFGELIKYLDNPLERRGGPRKGAGRKPIQEGKLKSRTFRLSDMHFEKLTSLGGVSWIRTKLDES